MGKEGAQYGEYIAEKLNTKDIPLTPFKGGMGNYELKTVNYIIWH